MRQRIFFYFLLTFYAIPLLAEDSGFSHSADSIQGLHYACKADTFWKNDVLLHRYSHLALPLLSKTKQWKAYVTTLSGLNRYYRRKSDFDSLKIIVNLAYDTAEKHLPNTSEAYGYAVNNLAVFYSDIEGNHLKALQIFRKLYQTCQEIEDPNPRLMAPIEENIGMMNYWLGDYDTALDFLKKSTVSWKEKTKDARFPYWRISKAYRKISDVYFAKGAHHKAIEYGAHALDVLEQSPGFSQSSSPDYIVDAGAEIQMSIAKNYNALHRPEQALEVLKKLNNIDNYSNHVQEVYWAYMGIANKLKGKNQQAIRYLERALTVNEEVRTDRTAAALLNNLANIYVLENKNLKALAHHQLAIRRLVPDADLTRDWATPDSSFHSLSKKDLHKIMTDKGQTLLALYDETASPKYLQAALANYHYLSHLTDEIRSHYQSSESQLLLLDKAKNFYDAAIHTASILYQKTGTDQYLQDAFFFAEKSKSELLLEELRKKEMAGRGLVSDSLLKVQYNLRSTINFNEKLLRKADAESTVDVEKVQRLESTLFDLKKQLTNWRDHIKETNPNYVALTRQRPITIEELQKTLLDDQLVLAYFIGEETITLFEITNTNSELWTIPKDFDLEKNMVELYANLKMNHIGGIENYVRTAHFLYQKLFPESLDLNKKNILIIPDGQLENLPFDILVSTDKVPNSPKKLNYLIKDFAVSYAYSATIFAQQQAESSITSKKILGLFPVFKETEKYLSFSDEVYNALSAYKGVYLKNSEATIPNFLNHLAAVQVVHFSTHGRGQDSLHQEPVIDLADGSVSLSDLQTYHLQAALAVLSACQTNVGDYKKGEGIMSLSRGFTYAGIPSIITSTANVKEESTSHLMIKLYQYLHEGLPKHEALRQAKLDFFNHPDRPATECTPYHWGTFLAIGNTTPVDLQKANKNWWSWGILGGIVFFLLWKGREYRVHE